MQGYSEEAPPRESNHETLHHSFSHQNPYRRQPMLCDVCFSPIEVFAVLPCNHNNVCATCIFKEIALLHNRRCPMCKVGAPVSAHFVGKPCGSHFHRDAQEDLFRADR